MIRARQIHGYSRLRSARLVGDAMIPYPCGRLTQCRTCRPQALPTASPSAATDARPRRRRSRAWLSVAPALLALLGNLLTACALSPYPPFDSRQADPPCTSRDAPCKGGCSLQGLHPARAASRTCKRAFTTMSKETPSPSDRHHWSKTPPPRRNPSSNSGWSMMRRPSTPHHGSSSRE